MCFGWGGDWSKKGRKSKEMRDNHDGYPELLDAYEREGYFFGAIRVIVAGEMAAFEFGLEKRGYISLKRILQSRPFEPRGQYRYFFRGNFSEPETALDVVRFSVRIEEGTNGKAFYFEGPISLVSNLLWFQSLKDLEPTATLKRYREPN
jgi:hypothetical protein